MRWAWGWIKRGWSRIDNFLIAVNRWLDRNPLAAYVMMWFALGFALVEVQSEAEKNAEQSEAITKEREERVQIVGQIIGDNCSKDNDQDLLLARLVGVALSGDRPANSELTDDQLRALRVFQRALEELQETDNCREIVIGYIEGDKKQIDDAQGTGNRPR